MTTTDLGMISALTAAAVEEVKILEEHCDSHSRIETDDSGE